MKQLTEDARPRLAANPWFVLAAAVIASFIVYWPCLGNLWYNDDVVFLAEADILRSDLSLLKTRLVMGFYRPIFTAYIMILKMFFGMEPVGYYILGIFIHALNGFAVWALARRIVGGVAGPLVAGATFLTFFSHGETTLWISAHNSSMLVGFSILAILLHIKAIETRNWWLAGATAATVGLNVFTKETGLTVVGWVGLAELLYFGFKSCISWRGLLRYALIAAVVAFYIWVNPKLKEGFLSTEEAQQFEVRVSPRNITFQKVAWSYGWLFSPWIHTQKAAIEGAGGMYMFAGIAFFSVPLAICIFILRRAWKAVTFATALVLSGLAGPCMWMNLSVNSSRFYYYPTVGAALVLGAMAEYLIYEKPAAPKWLKAFAALVILGYCSYQTSQIYRLNEQFFRPLSIDQTKFIKDLAPYMTQNGGDHIYIIEPEIPNMIHIQNALLLFYNINISLVTLASQPVGDFNNWIRAVRQQQNRAVGREKLFTVIAWSREQGVFEPESRVRPRPRDRERFPGALAEWKPSPQVDYAIIKPRRKS